MMNQITINKINQKVSKKKINKKKAKLELMLIAI